MYDLRYASRPGPKKQGSKPYLQFPEYEGTHMSGAMDLCPELGLLAAGSLLSFLSFCSKRNTTHSPTRLGSKWNKIQLFSLTNGRLIAPYPSGAPSQHPRNHPYMRHPDPDCNIASVRYPSEINCVRFQDVPQLPYSEDGIPSLLVSGDEFIDEWKL
jgi:hypothetical protein